MAIRERMALFAELNTISKDMHEIGKDTKLFPSDPDDERFFKQYAMRYCTKNIFN